LRKKLEDHLADTIVVGIALAVVGGAAGFFGNGVLGALLGLAFGFGAGVGVGVMLVALYAEANGAARGDCDNL
jgi:hypothetical protein